MLDAMRDGIEQISEVLAQRKDLTTVHMVSHGSPGRVQLGAIELSLETVNRYAWQLQAWAEALTDAAELLIYGCEVAKGDRGLVFVHMLHSLIGANVAASAVITGCAAQGGNWALETTTAPSTVSLAFTSTVLEQYAATLSNDPIQYNINGKDCLSRTTGDDVLNGGNGNDILLGLAGEKSYQILKFLYIHFPHLPTAPFHVLLKGAVVGIIKRLAVAEAA